MITAIGIGTDPTIRYFRATAGDFGFPVQMIDLLEMVGGDWQVGLPPDPHARLSVLPPHFGQAETGGPFYSRLIDLGGVDPLHNAAWGTIIAAVSAWLELYPGTVVNRPGHVNDNACKPLHEARLARLGFAVPPSLSTTACDALRAFAAEGPTVAKALSGQRADCRPVTPTDFADYREESGPVHLQRFVEGEDVRAHVIGDDVIAVRIKAQGGDYRLDRNAIFQPCALPADLEDRLRHATAAFGLAFAGWDLRISNNACWVLEANPMPGYSFYDARLEGRITRALIRCLQASQEHKQAP